MQDLPSCPEPEPTQTQEAMPTQVFCELRPGENNVPASISSHLEYDLERGGYNIKARSRSGSTPFHWAIINNNNPAVITALLEAGADFNARTRSGETPLHLAAEFNDNLAIITALLEAGADTKARTESGFTPLHYAARSNENPAVINTLIEAGADIKARTEYGDTPLHTAAESNANPAIITALLKAGADIEARNEGKVDYYPISRFGDGDHLADLFMAPFEDRANYFKAKGEVGQTPLHKAAESNDNLAIITTLLKAGADIEAKTKWGFTPLHWAAWFNKNPTVITVLLKAGADPSTKDVTGRIALDYAKENNALEYTEAYWRLNELQF